MSSFMGPLLRSCGLQEIIVLPAEIFVIGSSSAWSTD